MGRKKSSDDLTAMGCAGLFLLGLVIMAAKAFVGFVGDHPVVFVVILAVVIMMIGWWWYIKSEFDRHEPAISILRLMSYPDSKIQKANRELIDSYLHTIDHYNPAVKPLDTVLKENTAKASCLGEYIEAVHREFDADEKAILLDHAARIREADRTANELANRWHAEVVGSLQGQKRQPSSSGINGERVETVELAYADDDLAPFNSAIAQIRGSSLPMPVRNLAGRFEDKVRIILDMDFEDDIESRLESLLCTDLPNLVDEWKDVDELSRGRAKEQADAAFVEGFRRLCRSFETLLERQATLAAGNVSTKSIYLESKHILDEDEPFGDDDLDDYDDILPARPRP
jgi:hypothetical protein